MLFLLLGYLKTICIILPCAMLGTGTLNGRRLDFHMLEVVQLVDCYGNHRIEVVVGIGKKLGFPTTEVGPPAQYSDPAFIKVDEDVFVAVMDYYGDEFMKSSTIYRLVEVPEGTSKMTDGEPCSLGNTARCDYHSTKSSAGL